MASENEKRVIYNTVTGKRETVVKGDDGMFHDCKETVASIADCIRHMADNLPNGVILNIAQCNFTADRIEAAWRHEKAELESKLSNTDTARKFFMRRIDSAKKRIAELSEPRPRRNCDTVSDFRDAKRKFKDANAKGPANYCRRLCHWLLAPVAERGES